MDKTQKQNPSDLHLMLGRDKMDKRKKATAISYNPGDQAPNVVATGKGIVAENILEKASKADVPVYKDEKLAEELSRLDLGDQIPEELYQIVAEIMIFVSDLDQLRDKMV